jgi:hypothetical protein
MCTDSSVAKYLPLPVPKMMLTMIEIAQRLEEADVLHLAWQAEASNNIFPGQNITLL